MNAGFAALCVVFVAMWFIFAHRLWRIRIGGVEEIDIFGRPLPILVLVWLAGMTAIEITAFATAK